MVNKVTMNGERNRYTVQAFDSRYFICTKPFNARRTYLYFVADLKKRVRGPVNWSYGMPFEEGLDTPEGAAKLLAMLQSGEATHSRRNPPHTLTLYEYLQFDRIADEHGLLPSV